MVVGQRAGRARHPPCLGLKQPGGQAQQARFAAAVGSRHLDRTARRQREVEAVEQQPAAAAQRHAIEPQQLVHATLSSSACMSSSLRPK